MANRNVKWIFYTVLVGLIPVFARLLVWAVDQNQDVPKFDATDFIIFGLIVHISIINEIEHFNRGHQSWKNDPQRLFGLVYRDVRGSVRLPNRRQKSSWAVQ